MVINPFALRMAKFLWSFGHSECNRVRKDILFHNENICFGPLKVIRAASLVGVTLRHNYTPGIYAAGYIVFALTFVRSSVRMLVRSFVCSFVRYFPSRS